MPYVADMDKAIEDEGELIGDGQCVAFVHGVVTIPSSTAWRKGAKVRGNHNVQPGTVIAVFDSGGHYANHLGGSSHAAIYLGQDGSGIDVLDQWVDKRTKPVGKRNIGFRNGQGEKVDDGDQYSVVE